MIPPFDEALADLLKHYSHSDPEYLASVMEETAKELRKNGPDIPDKFA